MTTPPPIDPFTAELLTRLAQGAFHPPAPMPPPGLLQPPAERPSGLGQLAGLALGLPVLPDPPSKRRRDFLAEAPQGMSPALWQMLTGGS
ncbi:MAG: hypothetical protein LCH95_00735 [Proteobacteria bacterium]|nr:hypothetical protein [Pseudomonadota bacterium]